MSTIVTRAGKGSPLTNAEVDSNFTNLNTDKAELSGATFTGDVTSTGFAGDITGAVLFQAKAGEGFTKGDPVYISGISGNTTVVSKADANDANKMPCFGIVDATVSINANCSIVTFGSLADLNTSAFSEGDELYISDTGTLSATAPTGETSQLQKIAKVTRSHASAGSIKVMGAGRTNATPNLDDGKFFLGNASNQSVSATFSTSVTGIALPLSGGAMTGAITTNSTFDGRDVATDGTKLDGIEASATADQTGAQIKTAYEAETNAFTDAQFTKLGGIEASATADQTAAEIRALVESATDSNVFTDADHTKLGGIETSADVTDAANVTAAGALMDSELTSIASVKALDQGVATTDSPTFAAVTANGGVVVDNFTLDGTTLALSSGAMTLDAVGNIILDSDSGQVVLADGGSNIGLLKLNGNNLEIRTEISNADMKFNGNDGGSTITALTLDMSEAGEATFNSDIKLGDSKVARFGADQDFRISFDGSNAVLQNVTSDSDITFLGKDGSSTITALTLDMSAAGAATFNAGVNIGGNSIFNAPNIDIKADDARLLIEEADGTNMVWLGDLTGAGVGGCFLYNHGGTAVVQLRSDSASTIGHGLNVDGSNTYNRISSYFSGSYTSGFKFSDLNGGIWYDASTDDLTVSASHANSQLILEAGGAERMRINNTGAIFATGVRSSSSANNDLRYNTANGEIYYQTSSERYKSNIVDLEFDTSNLYNLRPVSFDDNETGERCFGLIAEDTFEQIPEAVVTRNIDGETVPDSIPYSMLSVLIINEMKNLKAENDSLKSRIEALEAV